MSPGDKPASLAAGVKDWTDPVVKLAADAYDSITSNGFKPIKKANDADVKKLTEALKKSASSTEMLAKLTEGEAKKTEPKSTQTVMSTRPTVGSDARSVVAPSLRPDQLVLKTEKPQGPRPEQAARPEQRQVAGRELHAMQAQKLEPRVEQTKRPRIFAQTQKQEAPLARVEAQQTIDKGLNESVLDLTAKMRDAVKPRADAQQAKDDKFLSNILTGAAGDGTAGGAPRVNTPPISRDDWDNAFTAKNQKETPPSLPNLEIVSTAFGSESGQLLDTRFGSSDGTMTPGDNFATPEDKSGQLVRKPDGSLVYTEENATITRSLAGEIQMQGANDFLKLFKGELIARNSKGRIYLDRSKDGRARAILGNDTYLLPGVDGIDVVDGTGAVIGKLATNQVLGTRMKMQTAQYLDEVDFAKAMERWRRDGNKLEAGKTALYIRFKSGFALVEPGKNQYTVVMFKGDNKFEVHQKLADGVTIVKDADNRYFLTGKDSRLELSPEQVEGVLKDLPEEQQRNLHKIMANLEKGVLDVPDGQLVLKNGRAEFMTIAGLAGISGVVAVPILRLSIDEHSDEMEEKHADGSKTKTHLDLLNRRYAQEETDARGEVTKTDVDLFDALLAKGQDWTLKNRVFETNDKFKVDEFGNVSTPGGSKVRADGVITFSNGMTVASDGTIKESSKVGSLATDIPSEKHIDALVRNGLSLAKALSAGGQATFALIALLEANLSIVSNLVGLFSDLGQLQEATKLFKVWGVMNESLCKARIEVNERIARSHDTVAMLADRFGGNTAGSGGWISCQLKAA